MVNIRLRLDESDLARLGALFDRLERIGERLEPQMGKAADQIRLGFQRNFESESGGGEPWDELASRTVTEHDPIIVAPAKFLSVPILTGDKIIAASHHVESIW